MAKNFYKKHAKGYAKIGGSKEFAFSKNLEKRYKTVSLT